MNIDRILVYVYYMSYMDSMGHNYSVWTFSILINGFPVELISRFELLLVDNHWFLSAASNS